MLSHKKIAVIGAGNMGRALIGGMLNAKLTSPKNITASRRNEEAVKELRKRWGIHAVTDNKKAAAGADIVILAVKPQLAQAVLGEIAPVIQKNQIIVSIMAGLTTAAIVKKLKKPCPVVRAMPNTPCLVDAGATAIAAGTHAGEKDLALAESIFKSVGKVVTLPESALDAVTGLSGSGPAYIFLVAEALIAAGVEAGLDPEVSRTLTLETIAGAGRLLVETGEEPETLRAQVTSPGGTTEAGLAALETSGLRKAFEVAVAAATARSRIMSLS